MAETRINPAEAGGKKFRIKKADHQAKDFPDQREIDIILADEDERELDVYRKDIPAVLKGVKYKDKPIRWMNNFGLKKKGKNRFEDAVPRYTLLLDKIEGAEYVYYDGPTDHFDPQGLHVLPVSEYEEDPSKVKAVLDRGDPAAGWVN